LNKHANGITVVKQLQNIVICLCLVFSFLPILIFVGLSCITCTFKILRIYKYGRCKLIPSHRRNNRSHVGREFSGTYGRMLPRSVPLLSLRSVTDFRCFSDIISIESTRLGTIRHRVTPNNKLLITVVVVVVVAMPVILTIA